MSPPPARVGRPASPPPRSWLHPLRLLVKGLFRLSVTWGFTALAVRLIARDVIAFPSSQLDQDTWTLLAINPDRFRGDLEILANSGHFRVLKLPFAWSGRLMGLFYPDPLQPLAVFNTALQPGYAESKARYQRFLARLLPPLYRTLGVDGVLGAAVHYAQDVDLGTVSARLGYPYLVLHRENLVTAPAHERRYLDYARELGRFQGSQVFFHNDVARQLFIASGFLAPQQCSAPGCLRMDAFLERVRDLPRAHRARPLVVLFSFTHGAGLMGLTLVSSDFEGLWSKHPGAGLVAFFESVHGAFVELARDHPETDFVIKTKWLADWKGRIEQVAAGRGVAVAALPNLTITDSLPAQDLILEASLVIGYGSTTVLEAGVARRPVILPRYHEVNEPRYAEYLFLQGHHDRFSVAGSEEELVRLVRETLLGVGGATIPDCRELFSRLISPAEGGAVARYRETILALLRQGRQQRSP